MERVTGKKPEGCAAGGFIHLINSGATTLDATGAMSDANGEPIMKSPWEMNEADVEACTKFFKSIIMAKEYFPQIGKIPFEGKDSKNPLAFHYYDADKVVT